MQSFTQRACMHCHSFACACTRLLGQSRGIASILKATLNRLPRELWSECVVLCTVCRDMQKIIFKNQMEFE